MKLSRNLKSGYHGPWWTAKVLALLGKLPDAEVAKRTGRTKNAVRVDFSHLHFHYCDFN